MTGSTRHDAEFLLNVLANRLSVAVSQLQSLLNTARRGVVHLQGDELPTGHHTRRSDLTDGLNVTELHE